MEAESSNGSSFWELCEVVLQTPAPLSSGPLLTCQPAACACWVRATGANTGAWHTQTPGSVSQGPPVPGIRGDGHQGTENTEASASTADAGEEAALLKAVERLGAECLPSVQKPGLNTKSQFLG